MHRWNSLVARNRRVPVRNADFFPPSWGTALPNINFKGKSSGEPLHGCLVWQFDYVCAGRALGRKVSSHIEHDTMCESLHDARCQISTGSMVDKMLLWSMVDKIKASFCISPCLFSTLSFLFIFTRTKKCSICSRPLNEITIPDGHMSSTL